MEEFYELTSMECYLCKAAPYQVYKVKKYADPYKYNGLDRIDNELGYIKGNVKPCCGDCNRIKSNLSLTTLRDKIHKISEGIDEAIENIRRSSKDKKNKEPYERSPKLRSIRPEIKDYFN